MSKLRSKIIKLAYEKPELRDHLLPLLVSKTAARPIPLDRRALQKYTQWLIKDAMTFFPDKEDLYKPVGKKGTLAHIIVDPQEMIVKDVLGQRIKLHIFLKTDPSPLNHNQLVWGGAGTVKQKRDEWAIILFVSEGIAVNILRDYADKEIFKTLSHEMTHILDRKDTGGVNRYEQEGVFDPQAYYNDPNEVRAFMREIVEEAFVKYKKLIRIFDEKKALTTSIKTKTWGEIKNHLTPRNKKLILKGAIRGLQELVEKHF